MAGGLHGATGAWYVDFIPPLAGVAAIAVLVDRLSCHGTYCPPEARAVRKVARMVLIGAVGMIAVCVVLAASTLAAVWP
jgi:hypothetical protein